MMDYAQRNDVLRVAQWGDRTCSGSATTSVTYPLAMSSVFTVVGNMRTSAYSGYAANIHPWNIYASYFEMYTRNADSKGFSWVAFGK